MVEENEIKYSTLTLMARVYLSRELSSCFQERISLISGFTGNKLHSTTDDDRAEKLMEGCVNAHFFENLEILSKMLITHHSKRVIRSGIV